MRLCTGLCAHISSSSVGSQRYRHLAEKFLFFFILKTKHTCPANEVQVDESENHHSNIHNRKSRRQTHFIDNQ